MKIGVIVSRGWKDEGEIAEELGAIARQRVVSILFLGGDTDAYLVAIRWARDHGVVYASMKPPDSSSIEDQRLRNTALIDAVDTLIAFTSKQSQITADAISKARSAGKLYREVTKEG